MCVIFIVDTDRPTEDEVEAAWDSNRDGGGVAWQDLEAGEGSEELKPVVRWKKGLTYKEMQELNQTLPFPYILHFRIASVGPVCPQLTHPFEVSTKVGTEFEGSTENPVLFHNGTWHEWKQSIERLSSYQDFPNKMGYGQWSDARGLAYAMAAAGPGYIELTNQKVVVLYPEGEPQVFQDREWSVHDKRFVVSNLAWTHRLRAAQAVQQAVERAKHNGHYYMSAPAAIAAARDMIAKADTQTVAEKEAPPSSSSTEAAVRSPHPLPFHVIEELRRAGRLSRRQARQQKRYTERCLAAAQARLLAEQQAAQPTTAH